MQTHPWPWISPRGFPAACSMKVECNAPVHDAPSRSGNSIESAKIFLAASPDGKHLWGAIRVSMCPAPKATALPPVAEPVNMCPAPKATALPPVAEPVNMCPAPKATALPPVASQ